MSVVPAQKKLTDEQLRSLASASNIEYEMLKAFKGVESGGIGFADDTGLIIIQFEPSWFKRLDHEWASHKGTWINNGIERQSKEWMAFNDAYSHDSEAAMKSTSVGMYQIMGFHYKLLGFSKVEAFWDYNNVSEENQTELVIRFIMAKPELYKAIKEKNFHKIAYYYNGSAYQELARKHNFTPYNIQMERLYNRYATINTKTYKTTATLNIRSGASVTYPTIQKPLAVNTPVAILATMNGWHQVKVISTGVIGWCSAAYIK